MKNVLEELWRGNIDPQSKTFKRGTEYDEALQALCKSEKKLLAILAETEKENFEKYQGCQDELTQLQQR